jgi:hypothetical protein
MGCIAKYPSGMLADALAGQINKSGYAVIEGYTNLNSLRISQEFVVKSIANNNGEYICFTGTEHVGETFLAELPKDPNFLALCHGIYEGEVGKPAPRVGF